MIAECGVGFGDLADGEELPFNEDFIVLSSIPVVRGWVLMRGDKNGSLAPAYHGGAAGPVRLAPQGEAEWTALLGKSCISIYEVVRPSKFTGSLLRIKVPGSADLKLVCVVNQCQSQRGRCCSMCCQYCEWLMSDCSILGYGRDEVFPGTTLAEMRRRIASAVAAELC